MVAWKKSVRLERLLLGAVAFIFLIIILSTIENLPSTNFQPRSYASRAIASLLRGLPSPKDLENSQPPICSNVIHRGLKGYWRKRKDLKAEDISYRNIMDREMRLKLDWPGSLYRNDSRCGMKFEIPGFRVQGNCDPQSTTPCCDHRSGYCSSKPEHCNCNRSTECTDYRKMLSAELAEWVPQDSACIIRNFTQQMSCDLLNKHKLSIAFIGDSLIRQLARTLMLFLTGNSHSGLIPVNASQSDRAACYADHQITKACSFKVTAHSLRELDPNSICHGKINFQLDLVENYKKFLPEDDVKKITEYLGRNDSFIVMAVGLHYRLDIEAVIEKYVSRVLTLIETKGNGWPKVIWMGIHSVPDYLLTEPLFNNKGILEFNEKLHNYLEKRNVTVIDTFGLSKQLKSYDGLHYGLGLNYKKIHVLLNHLEEQYGRS